MADPREVPELKVQERPPSTLRNIDGGAPGGARAGDPGAPTINAKNINGEPLGGAEGEDPGAPTINAKKHRRRTTGRCRS
jgi:hypothetical protein